MTMRRSAADCAYSLAPGVNRWAFAPVLSVDGTPPAYHHAGMDGDARVVHGPGEVRPWMLALFANPWLTFHPSWMNGVVGRAGARRDEDGGRMGHRDGRQPNSRLATVPAPLRPGSAGPEFEARPRGVR
jgi:hypothetical protein